MNRKSGVKILAVFIVMFLMCPIVLADDYIEENPPFDELDNVEVSNPIKSIPTINARYAVIYDRASSRILYGKNENDMSKMASTTKIMTAIIVIENVHNLKETVTISKKSASVGGSRLGLSTNDTITVDNLLYGLMMRSGNDAAIALAEYVGGSIEGFADLMNEKALSLGLTSTHFITPHGLDNDSHYTTAYELAKLTDYALNNEIFSKIVNTKTCTIYINKTPHTIGNTNELLGNLNGVYGVKTGFTNGANRCLVTACRRGDLDIICVVLGCDTKRNRTQDSINLINYAFDNFTMVNIEKLIFDDFNNWKNDHLKAFTVNKGISSNVDLAILDSEIPYSSVAIHKNSIEKISTAITFNSYFEAPLEKYSVIGKIVLKVEDVEYFEINIVNLNEIKKRSFYEYWRYFLKNYFSCVKYLYK